MRFISAVLGAALLAVAAAAEGGSVPVLTKDNFDKFIKENDFTLVKFMAPWCGHCKKLAPEYEAAAEELQKAGSSAKLAEVDATEDKELAKKFEVRGYPTLLLFREGEPEPYTGGRTKASILEWVDKMSGPAFEWVDKSELTKKLDAQPGITFVASFKSKKDDLVSVFEEVAKKNRVKGRFLAIVDADKKSQLTAHRPKEEPVSMDMVDDVAAVKKFVAQEAVPLFGPVSGENFGMYAEQKKDWLWFAGKKADFDKYQKQIRDVAKDLRETFNAVWLDTEELAAHAEGMLGLKDYPSIAVVVKDVKYHYKDDIQAAKLGQFVKKVLDGKVEKFLKSEPIPESNDDPVKVVVGKQFSDIVLQDDKDVFLKIYAPWCGHCKKLAPVWEELAEKTKGNKNFVVAKFDGTANEPDVEGFMYQGFPTLYFVKAGSKKPIPYEGDRTLDDLLKFAKKNAVHPIVDSEEDKDEL